MNVKKLLVMSSRFFYLGSSFKKLYSVPVFENTTLAGFKRLVSLFNSISTFIIYLMLTPSL